MWGRTSAPRHEAALAGGRVTVDPENHSLVRSENEIAWVGAALGASGVGGELHHSDRRCYVGLVAQPERRRAGAEVQCHEEPLVAAPLEAEYVRARAHRDLPARPQRWFADAQPDEAAHERERRPWVLLLRLDAEALRVGDDGKPGFPGG